MDKLIDVIAPSHTGLYKNSAGEQAEQQAGQYQVLILLLAPLAH